MTTDQERFWAGEFGDAYAERNESAGLLAANVAQYADILRRTDGIGSVLELGANIGMNLRALRPLLPEAALEGVEINEQAAARLGELDGVVAHHASILDYAPTRTYDLVFTSGVLIHIAPDRLGDVYDLMEAASARYVCMVEYYNPTPVTVTYRGHTDRLFKRDFAGEMMDRHGLRLLDYGFVYHRDPVFPRDDSTWFLMEKP